jgi:hypothetical protein
VDAGDCSTLLRQLTGPIFCRADAALFEAAAGLDAAALRAGAGGVRFALEDTLAAGECGDRQMPAAAQRRGGSSAPGGVL